MSPKHLDLAFDAELQRAAQRVEQRGTRAVAKIGPATEDESESRGSGAYRPGTNKRSATVRKTLRLDAQLVQQFEALEIVGDVPPITRLVERWLREYLDAHGQPRAAQGS